MTLKTISWDAKELSKTTSKTTLKDATLKTTLKKVTSKDVDDAAETTGKYSSATQTGVYGQDDSNMATRRSPEGQEDQKMQPRRPNKAFRCSLDG